MLHNKTPPASAPSNALLPLTELQPVAKAFMASAAGKLPVLHVIFT
jgi:hypothetical protein